MKTRHEYLTKKLLEWLRYSEKADEAEIEQQRALREPQVRTYIYSSHISARGWMQ